MTKLKTSIIFIASAIIYFIIIPEILFKHLSEKTYLFIASLTNPFHVFGSTSNTFIIALIVIPLVFAWLTVVLLKKISSRKK